MTDRAGVSQPAVSKHLAVLRLLLGNGDLAATLHLLFAAGVGAFLLWRFAAVADTTC